MFVRVQDKSTGHQFDVPEEDRRIGVSLEPVKRYPKSRVVRRPKHYLKLAGQLASREPAPDEGVPDEATEKEN